MFIVNEVLKPNEMIGVKEEDNNESVWIEIICKNRPEKNKARNIEI